MPSVRFRTQRDARTMPTTEDKIIRFFHRKVSAQEDGLKTMVVWCIGKGDRVPVEVILVMNLKNSRQYRDEKIHVFGVQRRQDQLRRQVS